MKTNGIRILLIEDNFEEAKLIEQSLKEDHFEVVGIAENLKMAIELYSTRNPDIVIVDIFLGGTTDGIAFAKTVNRLSEPRPIIFLTASMDRTIFEEARLTAPYSYLIKPFNRLELLFVLEQAIEKFTRNYGALSQKQPVIINKNFYVKKNDALVKVNVEDITHIVVEGAYCKLITQKENFLIQTSLTQLISRFSGSHFLRSHRNTLVNSQCIKAVYPKDNLIVLVNDVKLLLSRRYKAAFLSRHPIFK